MPRAVPLFRVELVAACWASCVMCVTVPADASAQRLIQWMGGTAQLGFSFQGATRSVPGAEASALDQSYREWLVLPFRGSLLDSRVLSYDFSLRPTLIQRMSPGVGGNADSREFGWDLSTRLFATRPVSLSVNSNRSSGLTTGEGGTRGDFGLSTFSGLLQYHNPWLPARGEYSSRTHDSQWRTRADLPVIGTAGRSESMRLVLQNTKVDVRIERTSFDDRVGTNDFTIGNTQLSHLARWGKGSTLRSSFNRIARGGSQLHRRQAWREDLRILHLAALSSTASFQSVRATVPDGGDYRERAAMYGFALQGSPALSATMRWAGRWAKTAEWGESVHTLGPTVRVARDIPAGFRLSVATGLNYESRSRDRNGDVVREVIDERHRVDETRAVSLLRPGAIATSVSVRSEDRTVEYIDDLDYRVVDLGGFVELQILVQGRIEVGDAVLVGYRYVPTLEEGSRLLSGHVQASVTKSGFSLSHRRAVRNNAESDTGESTGLGEFDENETRLTGRLRSSVGVWDLDAYHRQRRSRSFDITSYGADATVGLPSPSTRMHVYAGTAFTVSRGRGNQLVGRSIWMTDAWTVTRSVRLRTRIRWWHSTVNDRIGDKTLSGLIDLSWRFGSIDLSAVVNASRRVSPTVSTIGRASIRLVRRL